MLERCEFCELNEEVLRECGGFSCKDEDITEFFTKEYADYAYQLLGKSYCFVEQEERRIVGAFTVANSSIRADLLPNSRRNTATSSTATYPTRNAARNTLRCW